MMHLSSKAITAVLLGSVMMAAACSGSASPDSKNPASNHSDLSSENRVPNAEADHLLGSVDLPAPDWLPEHFPLPDDSHIYSKTEVGSVPPAHQLQARTMDALDDIRDAIVQWGLDSNIKVQVGRAGPEMEVMGISGGGFGGASSIQIIEEARGNRRIILTLQDES